MVVPSFDVTRKAISFISHLRSRGVSQRLSSVPTTASVRDHRALAITATTTRRGERQPRVLLEHELIGDDSTGQQCRQPETGQARQSRDQKSNPSRDLQRSDQVPEPLASPDVGDMSTMTGSPASFEIPPPAMIAA